MRRAGAPQNPAEGYYITLITLRAAKTNLTLITSYPLEGSRPAERTKVRRGTVRSRLSSSGWTASPLTIAWSKAAHTDIYDELGAGVKRLVT